MLGHVLLVRRAHPRSRGEHYHKQAKQMRDRGSSPLARGTYQSDSAGPVVARLIPARAGSTISARRQVVFPAAHPRSRGEHAIAAPSAQAKVGSSPLARGTLP